jgi:hypothetical protein
MDDVATVAESGIVFALYIWRDKIIISCLQYSQYSGGDKNNGKTPMQSNDKRRL